MKIKGFVLYKIYYKSGLVYLGRTKQPLQNRVRGHFFAKPMHRKIDINSVVRMEYAKFKTESDMNVYEIYLINKLNPPLNVDDKARDELTFELPHIEFKEYKCHLFDAWKEQINANMKKEEERRVKILELNNSLSELRRSFKDGNMKREAFNVLKEQIQEELHKLGKYY